MSTHTRSELRTLKTKNSEAIRLLQQPHDNIELIMNGQKRGSVAYQIAERCYNVIKTALDQQLAVKASLEAEQKIVGNYRKDKKSKTEAREDGQVTEQGQDEAGGLVAKEDSRDGLRQNA